MTPEMKHFLLKSQAQLFMELKQFSEKSHEIFQNKRTFMAFDGFFLKQRIFAKGVRDFLEVKCLGWRDSYDPSRPIYLESGKLIPSYMLCGRKFF